MSGGASAGAAEADGGGGEADGVVASAEADSTADADGSAGGGASGGSGAGAVSLRVQAAKTSATRADTIEADGLTVWQPKAAFVLGEHPIVSLLTIGVPSGGRRRSIGFVPTAPRGTKPA